ncbi:MAG: YigZ family protein [Victivallales bacterium]|nr:YigZ family protein [Victivallales bacterium]
MLVLKEGGTAELVVKRSRFVAELFAVHSQEEAREQLRQRKEEWSLQGIRHLVHAFICGPGANVMGCSDDGEPSGTAGRPVLEVLKGTGMTDVMLTVARFFGGIKLGTGGLVKAYTESAQAAVAASTSCELVPMSSIRLLCPYTYYEKVKTILSAADATITSEDFGTDVTISLTLRQAVLDDVLAQCRDISRGQCTMSST